jgi:hypothetical protein
LIVCCYASTDKSLSAYPKLSWKWLGKAVKYSPDYAAMLMDSEKYLMKATVPEWV